MADSRRAPTLTLLALPALLTVPLAGCLETSDATGGSSPSDSTAPWFVDDTETSGLTFVHRSGHDGTRFHFPEIRGGSVALLDVDGDDDLDVYFVQSGDLGTTGSGARNELFLNDGRGRFTAVPGAGGADDAGYGMSVATGDYDGDGDVDLYVTNVGANVLYQNQGDGTFRDVTDHAGAHDDGWGTHAVFTDVDRDGALDLVITNYVTWDLDHERPCATPVGAPDYCTAGSAPAQPDVLLRNRGDGTFENVSRAAGVRGTAAPGVGVAAHDFDDDGTIELLVANDGTPNHCWTPTESDVDARFIDRALDRGCAVGRRGTAPAAYGIATGDLDRDGDLDVVVVSGDGESDALFRNDGGAFVDIAAASGLSAASRPFTRFGAAFLDFNADGVRDLFLVNGRVRLPTSRVRHTVDDPFAEPNLLLAGSIDSTGAPRFTTHRRAGTAGDGCAAPISATSRAAAFGDVDGDGALDVVIVNRDHRAQLLRNVVGTDGHWIGFDVRDDAGAPALGAVVLVRAAGRDAAHGSVTFRGDVVSGRSSSGASDPRVHLGLGAFTTINAITIRWPDGRVRQLTTRSIDAMHRIDPPAP